MFEKVSRTRVRRLLERELCNLHHIEQQTTVKRKATKDSCRRKAGRSPRCTDERNMTRKTRSRQLRIHTAFQSGYCALCHVPYNSLEDHVQSKRHIKLIGDDANFISLKGFDDSDAFLGLDGLDAIDVTEKGFGYKMPRTRNASATVENKTKDSPMSPVGSDSGHHLRSRKNINYMTPPLEDDSFTEKPEVVKEYRELRSSSRLLAKLTDQITDSEEVWNSGRPKRSCNRQKRISADERLVVDNKSYYKVQVLPTKLRSSSNQIHDGDVVDDKGKAKKRSSELIRLHNEAESFLFPKKDDPSEDDERNGSPADVKVEDDESMHSNGSENRGKRRRRTHAEAFISDNQKYYKFETPGSRLRYQDSKSAIECDDNESDFKLNLDEYNFSFEHVPKEEGWYQTFQRKDQGDEKYVYVNDDNYWDSLVLPYQLDYVPPLDPRTCMTQYNQIKKCLMEPPSTSTSVGCSTPDPNASNSSSDPPYAQDEDSKISVNTEASSSASINDELKPVRKRGRKPCVKSDNGKNPRKSPRQHASTLAILSSLIHQRKRRSKRSNLPTIIEEPNIRRRSKSPLKQPKVDYYSIAQRVDEELANACCDDIPDSFEDGIDFGRGRVEVTDLLETYDSGCCLDYIKSPKRFLTRAGKPGRKPGRKKKNRTGWPNRNIRKRRGFRVVKDDEGRVSSEECGKRTVLKKRKLGVNNNKNDQSDFGLSDRLVNNGEDSPGGKLNNSDEFNNVDIQYQPYVKVQKLENKNRVNSHNAKGGNKRSKSPKRTNRGQRRMPASPKSPRMLRRPRGRWYRER